MSILKKTLILFSWIALILGTFFIGENFWAGNIETSSFVDSTFAQTTTTSNNIETNESIQKGYRAFIDILNIAIGLLTAILTPLIMLAGWLMSPDWTSGDLFNFREPMHNLWKIVSNIVYFVYAILLIVVAIGTIFQSKTYNKSMLHKILIGIVMVPFTWWFVQITISTSTAITASVLSIPQEAMEKLEVTKSGSGENWYSKPIIPKKIDLKQIHSSGSQTESCQNPDNCVSIKKFFKEGGGIYGSLLIYAYGIFKIQNFKSIDTTSTVDIINNIIDLIGQGAINTIIFIIFGLLIIALTSILLIRTLWLWVYAIFSPLFTIKYAIGDKGGLNEFKIMDFITTAFVPAIVGFVLSLGIVIIASVQGAMSNLSTTDGVNRDCKVEGLTKCERIVTLFGNDNNYLYTGIIVEKGKTSDTETIATVGGMHISGVDFRLNGSIETQKIGSNTNKDNVKGFTFFATLGTIIIEFLALIFIWIAFMAGAKTSKIAQTVIKPFENIGNQALQIPKKAAGGMPLPYFGNVKGVSTGLEAIGQGIESKVNKNAQESAFFKAVGGKVEDEKTMQARMDIEKNNNKISELTNRSDIDKNKTNIKNSIQSINNYNINNTLESPRYSQEAIVAKVIELHKKATSPEAREALWEQWKKERPEATISKEVFMKSASEFKDYLLLTKNYNEIQEVLGLDTNKKHTKTEENNSTSETSSNNN